MREVFFPRLSKNRVCLPPAQQQNTTTFCSDLEEFTSSPVAPFSARSPFLSPLSSPDSEELLSVAAPRKKNIKASAAAEDRLSHKHVEISVITLLFAAFRRTGFLACQAVPASMKMEIGWPTNVRHIAHVTFDQLNGFLGLPVELEMEIPRRVPSASCRAFGVSAESMQCSYDKNGNSVPTILLLLQKRLYEQGGLKTEGIFRINAEDSQEEHVRDQLNKGIVPHDIDVHCLAGLIKAWFRELPVGVLDSLSPDEVMLCHSEEQYLQLAGLLPMPQRALLNWAINLMADVVQEELSNKMNARNIAMVFAPNMTQVSDPLTALIRCSSDESSEESHH